MENQPIKKLNTEGDETKREFFLFMAKLRLIIRNHKVAVVLALLVSVIVLSPQVYFRIEHLNDGIYQGIELLPDSPRSALIREVQDGHPNLGNVYYKDGKDGPYLWQPLQPMAVAYMGKLFALDINNTILLSRLVLPFVTFLLIYWFVFLLSRDKLVALSSAMLLLLADSILSFSGLTRLLHGISPSNFLQLARPVNPAMTYIPLFAFLIVFWLFYKKRNWRYGIAGIIILGLNFYNYFYSWTYLYAFGGILVLIFLIQKKWSEAGRLASVFLGALALAVPYGINIYRATTYPTYEEASARFGVVLSHAPLFVGFTVILALVIFLTGFPREDKERYFFGLALLITPFLTMNQQLITGKVMQPAHYHWFFQKPIAVIFMLLVIFFLLSRWRLDFYKKLLAAVIITMSIFAGVFIQAVSYAYDARDGGDIAIKRQRYGPVMKWLSENAEKESVVLGNDESSQLTVIYTPLNVFYHRVAMNSLTATKARLLDVLATFYRLRGIEGKEAERIFFSERYYISWSLYGIYYRELLGSYEAIPDEKIEEALAFYKETLSVSTADWLKQIFKKYEVEYLIWDRKKDPLWKLNQYSYLDKVMESEDVAIFRFNP